MNSLELGGGWAAAIADDPAELQFFQENNRISSDDRNYWIGGLAYDTLPESKISHNMHSLASTMIKKKCRVSSFFFPACVYK